MSERIGVVLLHRGEPADEGSARDYLTRLYSDPHAFRFVLGASAQATFGSLLSLMDAGALKKKVAAVGRSQLAGQVQRLADALQVRLNGASDGTANGRFVVKRALRYTRPSVEEVAKGLKADGITRVVGVSLYPQPCKRFFQSCGHALEKEMGEGARVTLLDRFHLSPPYLEAVRDSVSTALSRAAEATVVFAALPIDQEDADEGELYPAALLATVEQVMSAFTQPHKLTFLEKGGPGLATDQMVARLGQAGTKDVVLVPLGTVLDELELLHTLETVVRAKARRTENSKAQGVTTVERATAVVDSPKLVDALSTELSAHLAKIDALGL